MKLMKKWKLICGAFCLAAGIGLSGVHVFAGSAVTVSENGTITTTKVENIGVANDYTVNSMSINTKKGLTSAQSKKGYVYKLNLEKDSLIKVNMRADKVTAYEGTVDEKSSIISYKQSSSTPTVKFAIYRDEQLWYQVSEFYSANGSTPAETTMPIALDMGTYYVWVDTSDPSCTSDTVGSEGSVQMIVYQQEVKSDEVYRPSTMSNVNKIELDKEYTGVLTSSNPKDYYQFTLKDKALVKFNCKYNATKSSGSSHANTYLTLYNSEQEKLFEKDFIGDSAWYSYEKFLEPGTYYYTLETAASYEAGLDSAKKDYTDGGETHFKITTTPYSLKLKQYNKTKNSYIKVTTIDDATDIRVVRGKLSNTELTSQKWEAATVITDTRKFGVNKTGYYTVRVTDTYGNMFMKFVKVSTCDKKAPAKPKVNKYKANSVKVTGTAEKGSTVTVTADGISYTCKANSKTGKFSCKLPSPFYSGTRVVVSATDVSGNVSSKVSFVVN